MGARPSSASYLYLQVGKHKYYADAGATSSSSKIVDLPAPRGSIFDRNGEVARHERSRSIRCTSIRCGLPNLDVAADLLAPVLHLDRAQLYAGLKAAHDDRKRRGFFWVKRKITAEEKANILQPAAALDRTSGRNASGTIPRTRCAAHVVGSVDHEEKGNAGIEMSLDGDLRGEAGSEQMLIDVKKRGIESTGIDAPQAGTNRHAHHR